MVRVSFSVSAVILGVAIANLRFGLLADKLHSKPIMLIDGVFVAAGGLVCAVTKNLLILIGARFVQGIFIPPLTICLAAYLARTLPVARLNVVMGSYVSATVVGGMGEGDCSVVGFTRHYTGVTFFCQPQHLSLL